jgi:2-oxoglutarate dehydrogenase E2 component (dihydrolipoamide succinyltransferase)
MRERYKDAFAKKHGIKFGFMSPFIRAAAYALRDQPVVNAVIEGNEIVYRDYVDVSVAVATPKVSCCVMLNTVSSLHLTVEG